MITGEGNAGRTERKPRLAPRARMRYDGVRKRFVLLLPERAVLLNETAAEVLQLCDGTRTVAGLIAELQRRYPGADLGGDVLALLGTAATKGWIEWTPP
jgi:pyrroloquinoline quinone biosynthesis protein D